MTREEAIAEIKSYENYPNGLSKECRDFIIKALEQEPRKGHWIEEYIGDMYDVCSECGHKITKGYFTYNYCPNCGAKMKSEVEHGNDN